MRLQEEENDNTKQNQTDASGIGGQYFSSGNVIFEMACNEWQQQALTGHATRLPVALPPPVVSSNVFG
jgi:hypothetical protein